LRRELESKFAAEAAPTREVLPSCLCSRFYSHSIVNKPFFLLNINSLSGEVSDNTMKNTMFNNLLLSRSSPRHHACGPNQTIIDNASDCYKNVFPNSVFYLLCPWLSVAVTNMEREWRVGVAKLDKLCSPVGMCACIAPTLLARLPLQRRAGVTAGYRLVFRANRQR
jgi:hypothetical protein